MQFCPVFKCGVDWVLSSLDPVSSLQLGLWFGVWITTDKAHITTWCENCIATASDSATSSECGRYCSKTFWVRSTHRSNEATPTFACPSVLDGELWFGNRVFLLVYKRVHTADGTRQNCSVSNVSRTTENYLTLSPIQFTPPTRWQDNTVLSVCVGGVN